MDEDPQIMTPEFSRPVLAAQIGQNETLRTIEATPDECVALAKRLGLVELLSFSATIRLNRKPRDEFLAHGEIRARAVRTCVVSLEDFTEPTDSLFTIRFVTKETPLQDDEDTPVAYDDGPDEVLYEDATLDLGEAMVQEYALSLVPYPRKPGIVFEETVEEEGNAFAILKKLAQKQ
ncbi:DUF177 domain-containing protein [Acidisoma cellulosilytica]|uniref:DUF177 domain-containing protein n=1 Tax=Acidisoma cellulosilyticum TaxID=2802395 RepID=A0A963Z4W9_9PROT|nr:DUF177 domain-containing protein [Acidisoma cellulosilyticum]MCB8882832.1 DUF177 domain-containing protein [Acidisoma cellulosilyticum]